MAIGNWSTEWEFKSIKQLTAHSYTYQKKSQLQQQLSFGKNDGKTVER